MLHFPPKNRVKQVCFSEHSETGFIKKSLFAPTRLDPIVERTPLGPAPLEQLARPHFAEELEADRLGVDGLPRVLLPHLEPRRQARRVDEVGVEVVLHVVGAHPPILRG